VVINKIKCKTKIIFANPFTLENILKYIFKLIIPLPFGKAKIAITKNMNPCRKSKLESIFLEIWLSQREMLGAWT